MTNFELPRFHEPLAEERFHLLDQGQSLGLPTNVTAIETIQDQRGNPEDIIARIKSVSAHHGYEEEASRLLVVRDQKGKITFRAQDKFGYTIGQEPRAKLKPKTTPTHISTRTGAPELDVVISAPAKKGDSPTMHLSSSFASYGRRLQIETAAEATVQPPAEQPALYQLLETNRTRRGHKVRRWLAGLVLAAHMANTTGGAIDTAMDAATDAGTSVEQAFPTQNPEQKKAVADVARTMQNLDDHNYSAIQSRAEAYKQQHAGEFMAQTNVQEFQNHIEHAQSKEQVLETMNKFMNFYGKKAEFLQHDADGAAAFNTTGASLESFRQNALGVIDAYSFLPKSMLEKAYFTHVEFASPPRNGDKTYNGAYHTNNNKDYFVRMVVKDHGSDTREESEETAFHEAAHAMDPGLNPFEKSIHELDNTGEFNYFLNWLVDVPADVSRYAAANTRNEKVAEVDAHLLTRGENKLAHPDDARLFSSPANRQLLERLISLERRSPGIGDYIVAHAGTKDRGGAWFAFWRSGH